MPNGSNEPMEHIAWGDSAEQTRQHVARIRDHIADDGLGIMAVGQSATTFGYCHTVGLTNEGHPEIVIANDCRPAMLLLDNWASWVQDGPDNRVTMPFWNWTDPTGHSHTYQVRTIGDLPHDPTLDIVAAVYDADAVRRALLVDVLSCPCVLCSHQIIIDTDGNYLREA